MTNEEIKKALCSISGHAQGKVIAGLDRADFAQMFDAGLVGKDGGLTRKGSIAAQHAQREQEERLFPL